MDSESSRMRLSRQEPRFLSDNASQTQEEVPPTSNALESQQLSSQGMF